MATSAQINSLTSLYVGYFDRAPDPAGLQAWINAIDAGIGIKTIAGNFADSAEAKDLYPYLETPGLVTPATFVGSIYVNLFNRPAETAGLDFWVAALESGAISPEEMILEIIGGAQGSDQTILNNKIEAGRFFAETAASASGYDYDIADAKSAIDGVTADTATVTAAKAATEAAVSDSVNVGTTFTLTTGVDNIAGTADNDTIIASNPATAANATLTVGDDINGGAGTDTLNIVQSGNFTGFPTGFKLANVENVSVLAGGTVSADTTTSGITGVTSLTTTSTGGATVTAAGTTDMNVTENAVTAADGNVTVNGGKDVSVTASGTADVTADAGAEISVGATTAATGDVNVSSTHKGADGNTAADIAVTGGKSVTVTQSTTNAVSTTNTQGKVVVTGDANTTTVTVNQDKAATAALTVVGKVNGTVTVNDVNAGSATAAGTIKSVSLNSYGNSTIDSSALDTVTLSGSGGTLGIGRGALTATPTENTLNLNVSGLTAGAITDNEAGADADDGFKILNIASTGTASTVADLVAADATTVNVSGDAKVTFTDNSGLGAVTDITVTNTGGAVFGTTAIGTGVTFTGGAGADSVILSNIFTKAITMGAGDDTVTVGGTTIGTGGSVAAGDGTDTVKMRSADAATFDDNATFNSKFTGFEALQLSDILAAGTTINLVGINGASNVVLDAGGANATTAVIGGLASGGTVTTKAASIGAGFQVDVANAAFNAADMLNLVLSNAAATDFGTVTTPSVEAISISAPDATSAGGAAVVHTLDLDATAATSITVSGNNGLTIDSAGNTAVTSFDASGVVGNGTADIAANLAVTFTSANTTTTATVNITGGAGNDVLTGNAAKDTIIGGAGNDAIDGKAGIDVLTGGAGADTFTIGAGEAGITGAEQITDFSIALGGDKLNIDIVPTDIVADQTATNVTSSVSGAVDVTVTVKDGIITIGGADAGLVDTLGEFKTIFEAIDADNTAEAAAFVFGGNTYVITDAASGTPGTADTANDIIQLVGVTGASAISGTDAADTIFIV